MGGNGIRKGDAFQAFDLIDESIDKYKCIVKFRDGELNKWGRIMIENRVKSF